MQRVAIYARVSTDRQELENQLGQLRDAIQRHDDWELVDEYVDTESGGKASRSSFLRLFDDAHAQAFDIVLFWSLDRFSREGTRKTINYLHELESYGVDFVSHTERYLDSTGVFKEAIIGILAALAKQERIRLSDRVKAGMERRRALGKPLGRPRVSPELVLKVQELRSSTPRMSLAHIAKETGLGRSTVGRILNS